MKRDFLKSLGIEDKDIIDKIIDENSADIGRAKGELETYKSRITALENDIKERDTKITDLQTKVGDTDALNTKIGELEADKSRLTTELNTKVSEIKKTHAIESGVRDAKARSVKAVLAHLDMDKITYENDTLSGLSEQLATLKSGEDTAFLFGDVQNVPSGTHVNTPNSNGGKPQTAKSFTEAIAFSLGKN